MLIAEQKPIEEIARMISQHKKILVVGCGTCVTVCFAGGEKEVGILSSLLKMKAKREQKVLEIEESTVERQCENEFVDKISSQVNEVEAILSLACGTGAQVLAKKFPDKIVYPGLNTKLTAEVEKQGIWSETCLGCGNCVIDRTGGVCPITRCAKSLLNGPCGGSQDGKCEISTEVNCAWQLIIDRLKRLGQLANLEEILPAKDWSTGRDGGPKKFVREDITL